MIKKIKSIGNFAVFNGFDWNKEVIDENGKIQIFSDINIIYGRNYSGKTTLSRILRAMETGNLSDKLESPSFRVEFKDGAIVTEKTLNNHGKLLRVFNEDFVRENLKFITNPDDSINPFAILGRDNNRIEKEIEEIEAELGSNLNGCEKGLYAEKKEADSCFEKASQDHSEATNILERQLGKKATDRNVGIKYKSDLYGDQNYNIQKLKKEIEKVRGSNYKKPTEEEITKYINLINEKTLNPITAFIAPKLNFIELLNNTRSLVTKRISESDKIEELVKNAILNRWVNEGRNHHKGKREKCAFCNNRISEDRWEELEKHFDKDSEQLEEDIDNLVDKIESDKNTVDSALSIEKDKFYSNFSNRLDDLQTELKGALEKYSQSLDSLTSQLKKRKQDILNPGTFQNPNDNSKDLESIWKSYEEVRTESECFSESLPNEQMKARKALRLKEIFDFILSIDYEKQLNSIKRLKDILDKAIKKKKYFDDDIQKKEELIASKKRELNDEEKGAKKVNEYLNNFFGHRYLTLEAIEDEVDNDGSKRIRFEVIRDRKKAYHLSEGECRLLAFCYFLAKLDDIETKGSRPIIWIDDPISSLDANHIFFAFSLLKAEIVSNDRFEQLFVSTHNLNFLKYLKKLNGRYIKKDRNPNDYQKKYFLIFRQDRTSSIGVMPKYMKRYFTEFNYLFEQIYKCSLVKTVDDENYSMFCSFGNNARKFLEIYLYYKYPDQRATEEKLRLFFGEENVPALLTDRINNEFSHCGVFERGAMPVEVPEMQTAAKQIIERLKEDNEQYSALLRSIGENSEICVKE